MTIRECAIFYRRFENKTCRLTLENGLVIEFRFLSKHFKHLLGLEKLRDIRGLPSMQSSLVYKQSLTDDRFCSAIRKSSHYAQIDDRIKYFPLLDEVLHSKIIIDFDPSIVPNGTMLRNTDFILYTRRDSGYVNLAIGGDLDGYYPETFFFETTKKYITGQDLLDIVDVEIIDK